jgi:hypothetical protein
MAKNDLRPPRLDWDKSDPHAIAQAYSREVWGVPGVLAVWAAYQGRLAVLLTLIEDGRDEVEQRVYEAELKVRGDMPQAPVQFHVYRNERALQDQVVGAELIYNVRPNA